MAESRLALQNAELNAALEALKSEIRQAPADAEKRVFLFQLYSVLGEWEKAQTQLDVCRELDSRHDPMGQTYEQVLRCERLRAAVFEGRQTATVLGNPPPWIARLQQAVAAAAAGDWAGFTAGQSEAFEQAQPTPGHLYPVTPEAGGDGEGIPFPWIADADLRFGPVIEAIVNGRYFWVPMENISVVEFEAPVDLRDLVWTPAHFRWTNQGEAVGFVPTRYPRTETSTNDRLRLASLTDWDSPTEDVYLGSGMRMFASDTGDFSIAEVRRIVFEAEEKTADTGS